MTKSIMKANHVLVFQSLLQYWIVFGFVTQLVHCADTQCEKADECKFVCKDIPGYSGDVEIDLSSLDDSSGPKFQNIKDSQGRDYAYQWNPCTTFSTGSCTDVNACQDTKDKQYSLGSAVAVLYLSESRQFVMRYWPGASDREMKVMLIYERGENGRVSTVDEDRTRHYTMRLYTKYAPHQGSSGGNDDSDGGISVGTVLVIIFFTVLVLYLGIGIAFLKYRRGAQGRDMIPNYEFWSKLPGLIKDGCIFSARKTKECVSDARERTTRPKSGDGSKGYEEIKDSAE